MIIKREDIHHSKDRGVLAARLPENPPSSQVSLTESGKDKRSEQKGIGSDIKPVHRYILRGGESSFQVFSRKKVWTTARIFFSDVPSKREVRVEGSIA